MDQADFLHAVQSRGARIAVGASAARGGGNRGVVPAAREYLRDINLSAFGTARAGAFRVALNRHTDQLRRRLPRRAQHWGLARKLLNIFLRDCLYTTYLNTAYHLDRGEDFYELPLDSITASRLRREAGGRTLPVWPGVRHVTPKTSKEFQKFAAALARGQEIARVHFDAVYWSVGRDDDESG